VRHSQLKFGLFYPVFANPLAMIFIILLCYIMIILHSWRWYRLNLVQHINLSFSHTILPTYLGIAFNTVLPGSVGGDLVRMYYVLKNFPQQKSSAILAILVDRITGLMAIFAIACVMAPYYLQHFSHNHALFNLLVVCISFGIGGVVLLLSMLILFSDRVGLVDWLTKKYSDSRWSGLLNSLVQAILIYRNSKWIIFETLIVSMITQALLLVIVFILCKVMGLPILPLLDFMLALVIAQVANLIPLTPGGVGLGEVAFVNVILLLHPGTVVAYATVFLALRLLSILAYLPGVLICIFGFHLLNQPVRETTASPSLLG
jgi:uncharacterized protein (TIRG00374 family)